MEDLTDEQPVLRPLSLLSYIEGGGIVLVHKLVRKSKRTGLNVPQYIIKQYIKKYFNCNNN